MTDEADDIDEPPQGDGPYDKGLWAEARYWVGWLVNIYGNVREIALVGISRRSALRLKTWLWSIEGIVRRLIIAAALAFDLNTLKPRAGTRPKAVRIPQTPEVADSTGPKRPSSAFRLLMLQGRSGAGRPPSPSTHADHRHLVVPADALVRIGVAPKPRRQQAPHVRRPHPLDRIGRISRWDPCYRPDPEKEAESYRRHFFGPFRSYSESDPPPVRRERNHRDIHDPFYRAGDGDREQHRRIEEEWERKIPAPSLAGRIMALHRVMLNPAPWIKRAARLIHKAPSLVQLLREAPRPSFRRHGRDTGPEPPGMLCLWEAHSQLLGLDTS